MAERTNELVNANRRLREEQQKLLDAEKMAALGRMVAGFAYELNTPIGIAVGTASHSHELVNQLNQLLIHDEIEEKTLHQTLGLLNETADLTLRNLHRAAKMVRRFKRSAVDQGCEQERPYELAEIIEDVQRSLPMACHQTKSTSRCSPASTQLYGPAGGGKCCSTCCRTVVDTPSMTVPERANLH